MSRSFSPVALTSRVGTFAFGPGSAVGTVLLGWAAFLVMAVLVVVVRGSDHLANMVVFGAIAIAVAAWVAMRLSRASLLTSLVLGLLHTVTEGSYLVAGATATEADAGIIAVDAVGLASGMLIVVGSVLALRRRRH